MSVGKVPESVRRAIADPLVLGDQVAAKWQPPADLPKVADVRAALLVLRADLEPVKPKDARWCLGKMAKRFGIVLDDDARQAWMTAHGKLPLDIWRKATLAALHGDRMPAVEAFIEPVAVMLGRRRTDLARTEAILARLTAPTPTAAFVPDPPDVRLRMLVKSAVQRGNTAAAARYERELAGIENRPPEAWAAQDHQPAAEAPDHAPAASPIEPSASSQASLLRARARYWRGQGAIDHADSLERQADALVGRYPDVITDIPESQHGEAA